MQIYERNSAIQKLNSVGRSMSSRHIRVDPGFLEIGFIYIKMGWVFALQISSHFFFTETKLFQFHRLFKTGGGGGGGG